MDALIATALRGEAATWPQDWHESRTGDAMVERIVYHGVAGLIADRSKHLARWPNEVLERVHEQAVALAMWELRHKVVLTELLTAFAETGIIALVLKGSALAYDLYSSPATRARGDSDILVSPADLDRARAVLAAQHFRCQSPDRAIADDLALQEVWSRSVDGTDHHVDLHWQLLNAPALRDVLNEMDCFADARPLPRLAPAALAMNRVTTLLHTCVHRAMHLTAPYFVDGVTYYGGDRLIWAKDIDLISAFLAEDEWDRVSAQARRQGIAAVCLDGLQTAHRLLGTNFPSRVRRGLEEVRNEPASTYLLIHRQAGRAWADFRAVRGWRRKLAYATARAMPSGDFLRAKYPESAGRPLPLLYVRRMVDLLRRRPNQGARG